MMDHSLESYLLCQISNNAVAGCSSPDKDIV